MAIESFLIETNKSVSRNTNFMDSRPLKFFNPGKWVDGMLCALLNRLLAVPFWIVERAREIAELKSRKLERTSLAGFFVRLFREPSRLSRKGLLAV